MGEPHQGSGGLGVTRFWRPMDAGEGLACGSDAQPRVAGEGQGSSWGWVTPPIGGSLLSSQPPPAPDHPDTSNRGASPLSRLSVE